MYYTLLPEIEASGIAAGGFTSGCDGMWHYNTEADRDNYEKLAGLFNSDAGHFVRVRQKHTDRILVVNKENAGEGVLRPALKKVRKEAKGPEFFEETEDEQGCDAMVTDIPGIMLGVVTADCVPVILLDPVKKAAGLAHSGWKGTVMEISAKTLAKMSEQYGSRAEDIIVCLGPYMCGECYEVGEDVRAEFEKAYKEKFYLSCPVSDGDGAALKNVSGSADQESYIEERLGRIFKASSVSGKYLLNMGEAIRSSLLDTGVRAENFHDSGFCTFEDKRLHSWRRTKDPERRNLTFVMLKK